MTQRYRVVDAALGVIERGSVSVYDMLAAQPWLDDGPIPYTVHDREVTPLLDRAGGKNSTSVTKPNASREHQPPGQPVGRPGERRGTASAQGD